MSTTTTTVPTTSAASAVDPKPKFTFTQRDDFLKRSYDLEASSYYDHYRNTMCLKPVATLACHSQPVNTALEALSAVADFDNASIHGVSFHNCVLPKGHSGKCSKKLPVFNRTDVAKKLATSVDNCIYSTPGNDDYVYKNRASRLFPIQLTNAQEKQIRNKQGDKLKCAIPLKDTSTPFLLATAYLDYITFVLNVHDISGTIDEPKYKQYREYVDAHKEFLVNHYATYNRILFTETGSTICAITKNVVSLTDVADVERDARVDIRDEDIQMGHIESRSETRSSIRGGNLVFMSRRGNLIIGDRNFLEDAWKAELRAICDDGQHNTTAADASRPVTPPPRLMYKTIQDTVSTMNQQDQTELLKWLMAKLDIHSQSNSPQPDANTSTETNPTTAQ